MPVGVEREHTVGREQRHISVCINVFAVCAAAWVVHQARSLEGGRISGVDADYLCRLAGNRLVFVGCYGAVQRQQHTKARRSRRVLACRIYAVVASEGADTLKERGGATGRDVVEVQRDKVAPQHSIGLAASSSELAAYKATDILQIILLRLRHRHVGRERFRTPLRMSELSVQLRDHERLRRPVDRPAARAAGDRNSSIVDHACSLSGG